MQSNPRLRFGDAADRWLSEQVAALRPATRAIYRNAVVNHLRPRWGTRRMDAIAVDDVAKLVRELRAQGLLRFEASRAGRADHVAIAGVPRRAGERVDGGSAARASSCWPSTSSERNARVCC